MTEHFAIVSMIMPTKLDSSPRQSHCSEDSALRMIANMTDPTITCPACKYDLSETYSGRCPECGASFDREALLYPSTPRVPSAVLKVMLVAIALPLLVLFALLPAAIGGTSFEFVSVVLIFFMVPYSVLLCEAVPEAFPVAAILITLLQGPVYGLILGLNWTPRKHARVWLILWGIHAAAIVGAWANFR